MLIYCDMTLKSRKCVVREAPQGRPLLDNGPLKIWRWLFLFGFSQSNKGKTRENAESVLKGIETGEGEWSESSAAD
jgi:hypothetical protein